MQYLRTIQILNGHQNTVSNILNLRQLQENIGPEQLLDVLREVLLDQVDLIELLPVGHDNLVQLDDVRVLQHSQQHHLAENSQCFVFFVEEVDDALDGDLALGGNVHPGGHDRVGTLADQL